MKFYNLILIFIVFIFSFTLNAEKVYENTDEKGVVEFSDKPSSDA